MNVPARKITNTGTRKNIGFDRRIPGGNRLFDVSSTPLKLG
ncbi:MAG: hypothetical protein WBB43_09305 [Limnoraphis sp.]